MYSISALDHSLIDLGRYWINPKGEAFPIEKETPHPEWVASHPEVMSTPQEKLWVAKYKDTPDKLMALLFADGWIRVSGYMIQAFNEYSMPLVAEFLKEHCSEDDYHKTVTILYTKTSQAGEQGIDSIMKKYGYDSSGFSLVAASGRALRPHEGAIRNRGWISPNGDTYPFGSLGDMSLSTRDINPNETTQKKAINVHRDWIVRYLPWLTKHNSRLANITLENINEFDLIKLGWVAVTRPSDVIVLHRRKIKNLMDAILLRKFTPSFPFNVMDISNDSPGSNQMDPMDTYRSMEQLEAAFEEQ